MPTCPDYIGEVSTPISSELLILYIPRSADIFYFNKSGIFKFILKFRHLKFFVWVSAFNEETVMLQVTEKRFFKCLF